MGPRCESIGTLQVSPGETGQAKKKGPPFIKRVGSGASVQRGRPAGHSEAALRSVIGHIRKLGLLGIHSLMHEFIAEANVVAAPGPTGVGDIVPLGVVLVVRHERATSAESPEVAGLNTRPSGDEAWETAFELTCAVGSGYAKRQTGVFIPAIRLAGSH